MQGRPGTIWSTTDMSMAAWMFQNGIKIASIEGLERRNEFEFRFKDPEERCKELSIDFLNSEAHKFDQSMRTLKKMCFGRNNNRRY